MKYLLFCLAGLFIFSCSNTRNDGDATNYGAAHFERQEASPEGIIKDISTGYNDIAGSLIAYPGVDDDWVLSSAPSGVATGSAAVTIPHPYYFDPSSSMANWIAPSSQQNSAIQSSPPGYYSFDISFDIESFSGVQYYLDFMLQTDNSTVGILFNGISIPCVDTLDLTAGFNPSIYISDQSYFRLGVNTLTINVWNAPPTGVNPVGLVVSGVVGASYSSL